MGVSTDKQLNLAQLQKLKKLFEDMIGRENELAYGTIVVKLILETKRPFEKAIDAMNAGIKYGVIVPNTIRSEGKEEYELTYYLSDSTPF